MTSADTDRPAEGATPAAELEVEGVMRNLVSTARVWPDILAVGLCGSRATGRHHPGSDIDVVLVVRWRADLASDPGWLGDQISRGSRLIGTRDWGRLMTELRFATTSGLQVGVGLVDQAWAKKFPVDPWTEALVSDGFTVLHDPTGVLVELAAAVNALR